MNIEQSASLQCRSLKSTNLQMETIFKLQQAKKVLTDLYSFIGEHNEVAHHLTQKKDTGHKIHFLDGHMGDDNVSQHALDVCLSVPISYISA